MQSFFKKPTRRAVSGTRTVAGVTRLGPQEHQLSALRNAEGSSVLRLSTLTTRASRSVQVANSYPQENLHADVSPACQNGSSQAVIPLVSSWMRRDLQ